MSLLGKIIKRMRVYSALLNAKKDSLERIQEINGTNILVLCYGNIYRSPFVAHYLQNRLPKQYNIKSAGFHQVTDRQSIAEYVELCREFGVDLSSHRSSLVDSKMLEWADMVILMDRHNFYRLFSFGYEVLSKVVWLGSLDQIEGNEILDPYKLSEREVKKTLERMKQASSGLINKLVGV